MASKIVSSPASALATAVHGVELGDVRDGHATEVLL
jgi:hypothetical protein